MADDKIILNKLNDKQLVDLYNKKLAMLKSEVKKVDSLEQKIATQMPTLQTGGIDDINKIIWPFWFPTSYVAVTPNNVASRYIPITQEAAFIWTHTTKVVFEKQTLLAGFSWNYVDPNNAAAGVTEKLQYTISDPQSGRTFFDNPISMNHLGHAQEPEKLDTPMLISANNNLEVKFYNNNATRTYIPFIMLSGYRVRIEDAQDILSLMEQS